MYIVPVVTLTIQDNVMLLQQLKSGFTHTINWKKYQSKTTTQVANRHLDYLIDPSFQGVDIVFFYQLKMSVIEHHTQNIFFEL